MKTLKIASRIIFAIFFVAAGLNHFREPDFYLKIMPPYLPWHSALVQISGVAEILLGIGLLVPKLKRLAAWGIIALLIAVFPANLYMAMNPQHFPDIPLIVLYLRLPLQCLLILWAFAYTRTD